MQGSDLHNTMYSTYVKECEYFTCFRREVRSKEHRKNNECKLKGKVRNEKKTLNILKVAVFFYALS